MDPNIPILPIMENQLQKKMEHKMETGVIKELFKHPGMQRLHLLGPNVCKYDLHRAFWIPMDPETPNPKACKV